MVCDFGNLYSCLVDTGIGFIPVRWTLELASFAGLPLVMECFILLLLLLRIFGRTC